MDHWKTTLGGVLGLVIAACDVGMAYLHGTPPNFEALILAATALWTAYHASDKKTGS